MEQKKTILIMEDEKNIVDILRFNLIREGYDTLEAFDGESVNGGVQVGLPEKIIMQIQNGKALMAVVSK